MVLQSLLAYTEHVLFSLPFQTIKQGDSIVDGLFSATSLSTSTPFLPLPQNSPQKSHEKK
jgi:hypothetical protein